MLTPETRSFEKHLLHRKFVEIAIFVPDRSSIELATFRFRCQGSAQEQEVLRARSCHKLFWLYSSGSSFANPLPLLKSATPAAHHQLYSSILITVLVVIHLESHCATTLQVHTGNPKILRNPAFALRQLRRSTRLATTPVDTASIYVALISLVRH